MADFCENKDVNAALDQLVRTMEDTKHPEFYYEPLILELLGLIPNHSDRRETVVIINAYSQLLDKLEGYGVHAKLTISRF